MLVVARLLLRTKQGEIEPENKANSRPEARGVRREAWGVGRANRCREDVGGQLRFPGARKGVPLPLLVISGLATGPPAGVGDGLRFLSRRGPHFCPRSGRFVCGNSAFSQQISTFYGSSVQIMDTQLNALPTLPVFARGVSGYLNSAFLGLFPTSCGRGLRGTVPVPLFGRELVSIRSMNSGPELWRSTHSIGPARCNVFFAAAWPRIKGS